MRDQVVLSIKVGHVVEGVPNGTGECIWRGVDRRGRQGENHARDRAGATNTAIQQIAPGVAWRAGWLPDALGSVFGSLGATVLVGWVIIRLLPRTAVGRALVLDTRLPSGTATRKDDH